jgi:hypothetical protein
MGFQLILPAQLQKCGGENPVGPSLNLLLFLPILPRLCDIFI